MSWAVTPDGWRYHQILTSEFTLGAHLPQGGEPHTSWIYRGNKLVGGALYPKGSWLIQGPHETYACAAVRDADFPAWLSQHQTRPFTEAIG